VRGTVKAAVLEGEPNAPGMLAISLYDSKPVHFLTYHEEGVRWKKCTRQVWSKKHGHMIDIDFWRLQVVVNYNGTMGWVDVANQLRNYLRQDKNMRNRKY